MQSTEKMNYIQKTEQALNEFIEKKPHASVQSFIRKYNNPIKYTRFLSLAIVAINSSVSISMGAVGNQLINATKGPEFPYVGMTLLLGGLTSLFLGLMHSSHMGCEHENVAMKKDASVNDTLKYHGIYNLETPVSKLTFKQRESLVMQLSENKNNFTEDLVKSYVPNGILEKIESFRQQSQPQKINEQIKRATL